MGYLTSTERISVDHTMQELKKHGTRDFPFQVYFNNFLRYREQLESWHYHGEMEFSLVLKGEFECGLNDQRYYLKEGDGIFVNSDVLHRYHVLRKYEESESISILFLPQFLSGGRENLIYRRFVEPVAKDDGMQGEPLRRMISWQAEILDCLMEIYRLSQNEDWITPLSMKNKLCTAWELFIRNRRQSGDLSPRSASDILYEQRAKDILNYIHKHYQDPVEIADIARQLHISRTECFRCFQKITGESPKSYLNGYRIRQAMGRLEQTEESITDICFSCGFNHMSYFVKRFREYTGMSPGKYRKAVRELEKQ